VLGTSAAFIAAAIVILLARSRTQTAAPRGFPIATAATAAAAEPPVGESH
jgi:hypothetical protein